MSGYSKHWGTSLLVVTLLLGACAKPVSQTSPMPPEAPACEPPPPPPENPVCEPSPPPQVQVVRDPALERRATQLELQLMERDARIQSQDFRLEQALQEVVNAMRKVQSSATRAEAASAMAETDVALQSVTKAGRSSSEFKQATRLMQQSSEEFKRNNYGGAMFLAKQAKATVRIQTLQGQDERHPGEVLFAAPVQLSTSITANIRRGPGTDFSVMFTAESGSELSGLSYVEEWIRVVDPSGNEGWIYAPLVTRR